MIEEGRSAERIAGELGISERTVCRYRATWRQNVQVQDVVAPGRPRILGNAEQASIRQILFEQPFSTSQSLSLAITEQHEVIASPRTVRRVLHEMNFKNGTAQRVPLLTDKHKSDRVVWALEHTQTDWERVFFTDETMIQMETNIARAWYPRGRRPQTAATKFPRKIMFWAAASAIQKSPLFVVRETLTADRYIAL